MKFNNYERKLLEYIQLPESAYTEATDRYRAVGDFLRSDASEIKELSPEIRPQGSFRLGTAIYPQSRNKEYDLDITAKCGLITPSNSTQKQFKEAFKRAIQVYSDIHGMKDIEEKRRCVRLNYMSSNVSNATFHIDIVPSIFDTDQDRADIRSLCGLFDEHTVLITDNESPDYTKLNGRWLPSNPEGFALWFESQMQEEFNREKSALMAMENLRIEEIPTWRIKTGLQAAVQLLKWHRDVMFKGKEGKPVSIILTTLAASVYQVSINSISELLSMMTSYLVNSNWTVRNPVDHREVFTDKWKEPKHAHEHLKENFRDWLAKAITDFKSLESQHLTESEARIILKDAFKYVLPGYSSKPEIIINKAVNKPYGY